MSKTWLLIGLMCGCLVCFPGCEEVSSTHIEGLSDDTSKTVSDSENADNGSASETAETQKNANDGKTRKHFVPQIAIVGSTGKAEWADSAEKPMSIITVPLTTYFRAHELEVFRIQIPMAMKFYQADNGRYPQTQEEFVRDIIEANQIKLPVLRDGDKYVYNPDTHEVMIEKEDKK